MPDSTGSAFPADIEQIGGLTQRLWLIAHAPAPPDSWLRAQTDDERFQRGRASPMDLDVRWRIRWANTVLRLNAR